MTFKTDWVSGNIRHVAEHNLIGKALNSAVYVANYASIQAALDDAASKNIPHVILDPSTLYSISQTLTIPAGIELDGCGYTPSSQKRAEIRASAALNPMIALSNYATVRGCHLNGNSLALTALFGQNTVGNVIENNWIANCTTSGVKFGGALLATLRRNVTAGIGGFGLDALDSYAADPPSVYYGLNLGISERNSWGGVQGGIRLEGILTSLSDDFEFGSFAGEAAVVLGGTVQSQMILIHPYFEMTAGTASCRAILAKNSTHLSVYGAQAWGQTADAGGVFLETDQAYIIHVSGSRIGRFATVFKGPITIATNVSVFGNYYTDYSTLNGFQSLAAAESLLCVWPGDRIGLGALHCVDGIAAPAQISGTAQIYVDTADGDLKVKFGDGVVKTLAVDT